MKLFMLLIGCRPQERNIEQHDIFFGIGNSVKDLLPGVISSWPEAKGKLHLDAWREVTNVNGFAVTVIPHQQINNPATLFFINLGGYKENEFEEFHYKMILAAGDKGEAIRQAKNTAFYKHTGFKGADSHIDDKYGIDVDDIFEIADILPAETKEQYSLLITQATEGLPEDEIYLGYFKLSSF
jgi:Domain of Unknown Function (DUF1543)